MFTRRGVVTVAERATAAEASRLLDAQGFGPVVVINQAGVVMGAAYQDQLAGAAGEAEVGTVVRFAVSTVRPSEEAAALAHLMARGRLLLAAFREDRVNRTRDCLRSATQVNGWMVLAGVMCSSRSWLIKGHSVPIWRASCAAL
jgi:hypothetical protein